MTLSLLPFFEAMGQEYDQAEAERLARIAKAWSAYYAKGPDPLRVKAGRPDDNTRVNFLRRAVDKSVSFLFGEPVGFQLDPDNETPEEDFLDAVWTANRKATTLVKLATNGAVCGHAFIKIVLNHPHMPVGVPRLVVLDPATVRVVHDPDDIETVSQYVIEYKGMEPNAGPMLYRQEITDLGGTWSIVDKKRRPDESTWTIVGEVPWPYPFAPVVDCQNLPSPNEFWGMSDLEDDVVKVQNALDFSISNIRKIVRLHGHPKTWAKGFDPGSEDVALDPDKILVLDDPGEIHNLEMVSDLTAALEVYRELKEALHVLTRVPPIATGKVDSAGPMSGVALRIHYGPLLELTNTKRMTYGEMLVELNRRLLAIGGHGDDKRVDILWADALPTDDLAEAQTYVIHNTLGVSKATLLKKLGYDPDAEASLRQGEAQEAMDAMQRAVNSGVTDNGAPTDPFGTDQQDN